MHFPRRRLILPLPLSLPQHIKSLSLRRRLLKILGICFFLAALFFEPCSSIAGGPDLGEALRVQIKGTLKQGVLKVFDLDQKAGIPLLMKAVELDREGPTAYAFLALAHLFFYEMCFDPEERERHQEAMLRFSGEALEKGEKRVEKDASDGDAYFGMALAKLAKIRWLITVKRHLALTQETRNIWNYLEKAKELNPENQDLYFAMGLLHYHLSHLPGFTRFLSSLLITSADRSRGLQELEQSAQKGYLLKELAQAELASVYYNFEKKPARALSMAQELEKNFPRNYNFIFALANILSDLDRPEEAFSAARKIEDGIKFGRDPFRPELWPRYFQLMGKIHFDQKDYTKAAEYFKRTLQDLSPYHARIRAWAMVRLGMIRDAQGNRRQAREYYNRALEVEGGEGVAQIAAKEYLKSPYVPDSIR